MGVQNIFSKRIAFEGDLNGTAAVLTIKVSLFKFNLSVQFKTPNGYFL
jgi:hypothetical protein